MKKIFHWLIVIFVFLITFLIIPRLLIIIFAVSWALLLGDRTYSDSTRDTIESTAYILGLIFSAFISSNVLERFRRSEISKDKDLKAQI